MQPRPLGVTRRALVAALVLYGILVQALLAGALSSQAFAGAGRLGDAVCGREAGGNGGPESPPEHARDCCLAACTAGALGVLGAADGAASPAWPSRRAVQIAWTLDRPMVPARKTSPLLKARGPPV
jgi:hypothetical protein